MDFTVFENQDNLVRKLYKNVENTAEVRKLIFTAALPLTLLNPKLIYDPFQLSVAITKALYNHKEGKMTAKTLPVEILYCLSPNKRITESLKVFGSQDNDTSILIVGDKLIFQKVVSHIKGEEIPLSELKNIRDEDHIKSVYQIADDECLSSSLLDSIVSRMASKDYVNISGLLQ